MADDPKPLSFFVKGIVALLAVLAFTIVLPPRPELNALRAFIVVGLVAVGVKLILRRYGHDWPRRRH